MTRSYRSGRKQQKGKGRVPLNFYSIHDVCTHLDLFINSLRALSLSSLLLFIYNETVASGKNRSICQHHLVALCLAPIISRLIRSLAPLIYNKISQYLLLRAKLFINAFSSVVIYNNTNKKYTDTCHFSFLPIYKPKRVY